MHSIKGEQYYNSHQTAKYCLPFLRIEVSDADYEGWSCPHTSPFLKITTESLPSCSPAFVSSMNLSI